MLRVAGRIHWLTIAALAGVVLMVGVLLLGSGDNPQTRASVFMSALARGDAQELAKSTYVQGKTEQDLLEGWKKTTDLAQHYRFKYKILGVQASGSDSAQVRMHVWRDLTPGGYEENFQLDLTKVDGKWKVRGNGLNREMYPFLPRF